MVGQVVNAGVLALQGCIDPHVRMLEKCGATVTRVRTVRDLEAVDRLILPGGESTTMLKLLDRAGLTSALRDFGKTKPMWGVCAGSILLAKEVRHPDQFSLELIPVRATRNYYGSQIDSFKASVEIPKLGEPLLVDFIRAPLLEALSDEVEVLGEFNDQQVLLRKGKIMVSSFHIELTEDQRLHEYFCGI